MARRKLQRVTAVCLLTVLTVFSVSAQDYKALIGRWSMASENEGGDPVNWTLVLKDSDGKLSGSLAAGEGEQIAKNFSYENGVLRFKAPYQGQDYDIELKVVAGKLDGTWSGGGNSGKTSGAKQQQQ